MENVLINGDSKFRLGADGLVKRDDINLPLPEFATEMTRTVPSVLIYVSCWLTGGVANVCISSNPVHISENQGSNTLIQLEL